MKIALKGKIGAGKTTVAKYIVDKYGYTHYNCDEQVALLYTKDKDLIKKINSEILEVSNVDKVDKSILKEIVFNDLEKLKQLEQLVYPKLLQQIEKLQTSKIIFDCQQIDKLNLKIDAQIYIDIDEEIQIKRVTKRDNRDIKEIKKIIDIQQRESIVYDYLIENNQTNKELEQKIDVVIRSIHEKNRKNC